MSKLEIKAKLVAFYAMFKALFESRKSVFLSNHSFVANRRGMTGRILMLVVNVYVVAFTVPGALVYLTNAENWTGVPAPVLTLGTTVLAIVVVTVLIIMFLRSGGISD